MRRAAHSIGLTLMLAMSAPAVGQTAMTQETQPSTSTADTLYCQERQLGYWFYCIDPEPEPREDEATSIPATSAAEELDAITGELRELKAQAILYPTPANVTAYIRFQREQLDRASLFSDVWQRALWQDPALDYTLERPVGALAKRQWQDAVATKRDCRTEET